VGRRGGFRPGRRWPRKSSLRKFKDRIREKTRRSNGRKLDDIIQSVNATTHGWFGYFKHSLPTTFVGLDGWIRMRLRCILRKRRGRRGRGYLTEHQRWPNAFSAGHGLYSMEAAHAELCAALQRRRTARQPR
jgi:RNA-directed DNA polymerase